MNLGDFQQSLYNVIEIADKSDFNYNDSNRAQNLQCYPFHEHQHFYQQKQCLQTGENLQHQKKLDDTKQKVQHQQADFQKLQVRRIRKIQVNARKLQQIDKVKKGQCDQTNCLNKNLHTETKNFLKKMMRLRCVDSNEVTVIKQYIQNGPSFKSTQNLYSVPSLEKICLQYYKQAGFLKHILVSEHMSFKNKTIMLKYLGRIHKNASSQKMRWKDSFGQV